MDVSWDSFGPMGQRMSFLSHRQSTAFLDTPREKVMMLSWSDTR